ncbi:hypothetical protein CHS0354_039072 [Potamilus streckersoni]|uniref:NIDO domain-containing protein n=1 Tax=Potamilus streckersoni TaxID=2493646 RepID=A0AAE0RRN9_9BIVA|nr:hypothetical protein CHS0354_039072 [Potamilus streckersoni]
MNQANSSHRATPLADVVRDTTTSLPTSLAHAGNTIPPPVFTLVTNSTQTAAGGRQTTWHVPSHSPHESNTVSPRKNATTTKEFITGVISFNGSYTAYTPSVLAAKEGLSLLAPYHADIDFRYGTGAAYYHLYNTGRNGTDMSLNNVKTAEALITRLTRRSIFTIQTLLIVTWDKGEHYGDANGWISNRVRCSHSHRRMCMDRKCLKTLKVQ